MAYFQCLTCQRVGTQAATGRKRKYCDQRCAVYWDKLIRKVKRRPVRSCLGCAVDFQPNRSDQMYCTAKCNVAASNRRHAAQRRGRPRRRRPLKRSAQCPTCQRCFAANTPRHTYCSQQCANYWVTHARQCRTRRPKTCEWCFASYRPGRIDQRYCSTACNVEAQNRVKVWGALSRTEVWYEPCAHCGVLKTKSQKYRGEFCARCTDIGHTARRQHRRRANESEPYTRTDIYERDESSCQLCGQRVDLSLSGLDPHGPTIDHIVPLSQDGADAPHNVQLAHRICNNRKGDRTMPHGEQLRLVG